MNKKSRGRRKRRSEDSGKLEFSFFYLFVAIYFLLTLYQPELVISQLGVEAIKEMGVVVALELYFLVPGIITTIVSTNKDPSLANNISYSLTGRQRGFVHILISIGAGLYLLLVLKSHTVVFLYAYFGLEGAYKLFGADEKKLKFIDFESYFRFTIYLFSYWLVYDTGFLLGDPDNETLKSISKQSAREYLSWGCVYFVLMSLVSLNLKKIAKIFIRNLE